MSIVNLWRKTHNCKCIILCLKHLLENNISLEISGIFILQGFFVNHYNQSIYQKVSGRIQINLDKGRRRSYFLRNLFPDFISTIIIRSLSLYWSILSVYLSLYLSWYLSLYLFLYLSLYLHPSIANESSPPVGTNNSSFGFSSSPFYLLFWTLLKLNFMFNFFRTLSEMFGLFVRILPATLEPISAFEKTNISLIYPEHFISQISVTFLRLL